MPHEPWGDPGDGSGDDDGIDDTSDFRPPLPPEDRIWRHPSEVTSATRPPQASTARRSPARGTAVAMVAVSALIGATLSLGVVAALGGFDDRTRVVERQVAVQPVTSNASDSVAAITERTAPSIAGVHVTRGDDQAAGTAVVLRSDGHLLTTAHLVEDADEIVVRLHDGAAVPAEVVGTDAETDLAVLRVDVDGVEPAVVGSIDHIRLGDDVISIGHAANADGSTVVDRAVVAALDQRLRAPSGEVLHGMILLDGVLPAASAGGALVDRSGAVVGITSAVPASDDDEAYGVALPIDVAIHACDQLIEFGRVRHVWLGVEGVDLGPEDASAIGVRGGATVEAVIPGSPAEAAGLRAGDVIVGVDGEPVTTMSELIAALRMREPGEEIAIEARRGDETVFTTASLAERDER